MYKKGEIDQSQYINDIKECTIKMRHVLPVLKITIQMNVISSLFVLIILLFFPLLNTYHNHIIYYIVLVSMFLLQVSLLIYLRRKAMDFKEIRKSVFHKWTWLMDNSEWGKARRRSIHKGFTEIERNVINDYYAVISSKFSPYSSKNYYSLSMKFSKIIILLIVYFAFVRLLKIIFGF